MSPDLALATRFFDVLPEVPPETWRPRAMLVVPALEWAAATASRLADFALKAKYGLCERALAAAYANDLQAIKEFVRDQIGLPTSHWDEVVLVLTGNRWRGASNPISFVRKVASHNKRKFEQTLSKSLARTNKHGIEPIAEAVHGASSNHHRLFELFHDSHLDAEEFELIYANSVIRVPFRLVATRLGPGWDSKRVERVRRRAARKLELLSPSADNSENLGEE